MKDTLRYRIKAIRMLEQISQSELANVMGVTQSMISSYENGKAIPKLDSLYNLAKVANINLEWLINRNAASTVYERTIDEIAATLKYRMSK